MRKRRLVTGCFLGVLMVAAFVLFFYLGRWVERNTPVKEVTALSSYYGLEEEEAVIFLNGEQYEKTALLVDGHLYLELSMVQELFLPRMYRNAYEEAVFFTTPDKVYQYPFGSTTYLINETEEEAEYPIALLRETAAYLSLAYIMEEVELEAVYTPEPGRLLLFSESGEYACQQVKKATQVREGASVKSHILKELEKGEKLYFLGEAEDDFFRVLTADGVLGYVRSRHLEEAETSSKHFAGREEDYTSVRLSEPVVLVWHQVFNQTANSYVADKLAQTEGVNVISPTWFSIENTNGKLSTLANEDYVKLAHSEGVQVWPIINDFDKSVNYDELFGREVYRRNLIQNIFYFVRTYDLDGINIDFENITAQNSRDYILFLRELSVACRKEGIVLSIDNYVPMPHTAFYDRTEQGVLADYVMVMAYDEHYAGSDTAGSVSSLSWVERGITGTAEEVPLEKIVVGLPFYTRLWKETNNADGTVSLSSEACSMNVALNLLDSHEVTPEWDEESGQYYGEYEENGVTCRIWLEEERSMAAKLELVSGYDVGGIAFWKLGLEREEIWKNVLEWKTQ